MKGLISFLVTSLLFTISIGAFAWGQAGQIFPGYQAWQRGGGVSAALYVAQWQSPTGYAIRLFVPEHRTGDVHIILESNSIIIRSEGGEKLTPTGGYGPVFMQFGSFSQWLNLPLDANMSEMKLNAHAGVIDIFIPRKF